MKIENTEYDDEQTEVGVCASYFGHNHTLDEITLELPDRLVELTPDEARHLRDVLTEMLDDSGKPPAS